MTRDKTAGLQEHKATRRQGDNRTREQEYKRVIGPYKKEEDEERNKKTRKPESKRRR